MSQKPSYFRIGLFVVVALVVLAGGLIAFGAGQMFRPRIYIETYVDGTVQGIDVGSPVKFRGVPIGRVNAINFTFNEYETARQVDRFNYVLILMEIDREMFPGMFEENLTPIIEKNVAQGMRARIEPQGVTGINYIDINYVNDPNQFPPLAIDWNPHHYYIPSAPGQLTNMLDSINNIMRQIEELNIGGMSNSPTSTRRSPELTLLKSAPICRRWSVNFGRPLKQPTSAASARTRGNFSRPRAKWSTVLRSRIRSFGRCSGTSSRRPGLAVRKSENLCGILHLPARTSLSSARR